MVMKRGKEQKVSLRFSKSTEGRMNADEETRVYYGFRLVSF